MFNTFNKKEPSASSDKNSDNAKAQAKEQQPQSKGTTFGSIRIGDAQPKDIPRKEK